MARSGLSRKQHSSMGDSRARARFQKRVPKKEAHNEGKSWEWWPRCVRNGVFWDALLVFLHTKVTKRDRRSRLHGSTKIEDLAVQVGATFGEEFMGGAKVSSCEALSEIFVILGVRWGSQNKVKILSHPSPTPPLLRPWRARDPLCAVHGAFLAQSDSKALQNGGPNAHFGDFSYIKAPLHPTAYLLCFYIVDFDAGAFFIRF